MSAPNQRLMPEPIMRASTSNTGMGSLVHAFRNGEPGPYADLYEEGQETLLGFFIPPFQRPAVWTRDQSVAFVENAWRGIHIGTYVVNRNDGFDDRRKKFARTDLWLIDGQQRLRAVESYLKGQFPVFGHLWGDLPRVDQRRFENLEFAKSEVREGEEDRLRFLYDCLNFGGVPHTEDQRAMGGGDAR